jgi:hypothetical protein
VKYTPQWEWLQEELERVDREKTPWLIVLMHVPIYNSNEAHFMEGESMRAVFEEWFVHYKVDVIFAGHVHAYERSVCFFPFISFLLLCNMVASVFKLRAQKERILLGESICYDLFHWFSRSQLLSLSCHHLEQIVIPNLSTFDHLVMLISAACISCILLYNFI